MITQYEIGIVGGGNAAEGIVRGLLRRSILLDDRIIVSDPLESRRAALAERFNIATTDDNRELVNNSYLIVLAVKPQVHKQVIAEFAEALRDDHVLVSVMAGVSTATLEAAFPHLRARVVRVMPNLAMHVGEAMTAVYAGRHCNENDLVHARRIFDSCGRTMTLDDESLMDAVTAVSGSGPAYFYHFVEALVSAGQSAGLSREQAVLLSKQAALGAARMMIESDDPPDVLRKKVMSPGGTTEAAFEKMRSEKVFEHIVEAVLAAHKRSQDLGH